MPPRIPVSVGASLRPSTTIDLINLMSTLSLARPTVLKTSTQCLQTRCASILSSLSDTPGAYSKKIRRGRGPSSGKGKTSGRGHKGQKQHGKVPARFQGGQTPQWISHHVKGEGLEQNFSVEMSPINLDKIQSWIDQGRLDPTQPITIKELASSRCLHGVKDGVKLLARGAETLRSPINILVSRASAAAIEAIEAKGGSVTTRYYTKASIKKVLAGTAENSFVPLLMSGMEGLSEEDKKAQRMLAQPALGMHRLPDPTSRKDIEYYRDQAHRGYLSHLVPEGHGPSLFFKTPGMGVAKVTRKKAGGQKAAIANALW